MIQPEQDARGEYGNGWKGVYRWCETNGALVPALFSQISPKLDVLVIHIDGDVFRKEKEVHCNCQSTRCSLPEKGSPLDCCLLKRDNCPVNLPCPDHIQTPDDARQHLESVLCHLLNKEDQDKKVIITVPCDSTDAWIVAAFDDFPDYESISDPWDKIISLKKEYHGIRIPGHKKSAVLYRQFMARLSSEWDTVRARCRSAEILHSQPAWNHPEHSQN